MNTNLRRLCLFLALLTQVHARQDPGQLQAAEPHSELSSAEVDAQVAGRFRNDGVTAPVASSSVNLHLLEFTTTAPDGSLTSAVAQLFVPTDWNSEALLVFAPGSTGLSARCGPMAELLNTGGFDTYAATALAFAGQGIATVHPDYQYSLAQDDLQPYFVAMAEAPVVIDSLRAASAALDDLGVLTQTPLGFMAGYSQGGHAVLAAADRLDTYAPDLEIGGVIGFGPSGEVEVLFRHFHYTAPWAVWAYLNTYPTAQLDAADVLAPRYLERLEESVRSQCIAEAQNTVTAAPSELYTPEFFSALDSGTLAAELPEWAEVFAANDTGVSSHGLPVLILQGVDDGVVPFTDQTRFVRRLCQAGSPVRYANFVRTRHETRYVGFEDTLRWINTLLAGDSPPDDCQEVAE